MELTQKLIQVLDLDIVKSYFVRGKRIDKDINLDNFKNIFIDWLQENREFKNDLLSLDNNTLIEYNQRLTDYSNKESVIFVDTIKAIYRELIRDIEKKKLEEKKKYKFNTMSFSSLINLEDNLEYLVEGYLGKGTLQMLYSDGGLGKSFISLYMALCLATGKEFLKQPVKKSNVLYIDLENPAVLIKQRAERIKEFLEVDNQEINIDFIFKEGDVTDYEYISLFLDFIDKNDYDVIFIDTIRRFGNFDENSSTEISSIYHDFFNPLLARGKTIVFLHHTSKSGTYRGSGDFKAMVDSAYELKRARNSNKFTLRCEKARAWEIEEINGESVIEIVTDDNGRNYCTELRFMRVSDDKAKLQNSKVLSDMIHFVKSSLNKGEIYRYKDIWEQILYQGLDISESSFKAKLKDLINMKILLKSNNGYELHPEFKTQALDGNIQKEVVYSKINNFLKETFKSSDKVLYATLIKTFSETYVKEVLDLWKKKGLIYEPHKDEFMITDLFKAENRGGQD